MFLPTASMARCRRRWPLLVACLCMVVCQGCREQFWRSRAPDFEQDPAVELTVIWDVATSPTAVTTSAWTTTNAALLRELSAQFETKSWESATLLLTSHPTRIIMVTQSGACWEIHAWTRDRLSLFKLSDPGWSGKLSGKGLFFDMIEAAIEKDLGQEVNLDADFTKELHAGTMTQTTPEDTLTQIQRFRPTKP